MIIIKRVFEKFLYSNIIVKLCMKKMIIDYVHATIKSSITYIIQLILKIINHVIFFLPTHLPIHGQ